MDRPIWFHALPGSELVEPGLADLAEGRETLEALVVAIGAPKLRSLGLVVPRHSFEHPEHALYERLAQAEPESAHSRYNALIRRLVRFERALACVS
jgi:hypothetical protein